LAGDGAPAHEEVARLGRLADAAETRRSPMLYAVVQLATLWDFHLVWLLERWKARAGTRLRGWLAALGEVEALAAFGTLAHENPGWAVPELVTAPARLEAEALGHPLLAPDAVVPNDVALGPPGRFLLVTGSNMAGKSTLVRAIGLNVVLAQAGAPVCARRLRCPPLAPATSMRVHDSLERGVSFFMAELERLKVVVDAARAAQRDGRRTTLFLLDEMLQGTNSAERTIAARAILAQLLATGAVGAVTTHDLALAAAPDGNAAGDAAVVWRAAEPVHFAEQVTEQAGRMAMTFDYRMRAGVATSTNALKLLRLVGLDGDVAPRRPAVPPFLPPEYRA
ncbi:MAG: MutS-related protein, family 1, partial [uncultured Gemmatimonadaceae bacterium]